MSHELEILREYWAIVLGFVATIVWAVRVEAGMKANKVEIEGIRRQRHEDLQASKDAREETNKMLAEIRADIKALLAQGAAIR